MLPYFVLLNVIINDDIHVFTKGYRMSNIRGKLEKVARERGADVETVIREEIERTGSVNGAAGALGVAPNAISVWLRRNRFEVVKVQRVQMVKVVG
jgi:hypothetical protein